MDRLKIFSDGSLGAATAALRIPSSGGDDDKGEADEIAHKGLLIHNADSLAEMIHVASSHNYRLEIHAIGDAAASQVLDCLLAYKASVSSSSTGCVPTDWRPVITHCQILGKDLIEKMKSVGAVANVQPSFVPTGGQGKTLSS